jgi:formylglycine-generating enzyme required for sulfatase activity
MVSFFDAHRFCLWLTKVSGSKWRLPSNLEWDAAVGGSTYPWGDHFPPEGRDGNYATLQDGNTDPQRVGLDGIAGTSLVGSFKPNSLGFFDLGGNLSEWTYSPGSGALTLRGGNWTSKAERSDWVFRIGEEKKMDDWFGFRVAIVKGNRPLNH